MKGPTCALKYVSTILVATTANVTLVMIEAVNFNAKASLIYNCQNGIHIIIRYK